MQRRWGFVAVLILIGLAVAGQVAEAQPLGNQRTAPQAICTWTSSAVGNWNDPTKWTGCAGGVPGAADTAIVSSGTITLTSNVTLGTLTFSGGTIQGNSNLVVTTMTWTGGTFKDAGTTTVNGTLDMSNSSCTLDGRTLINAGSATFGGSSVYLILYNNAVFTNQAGASLQFSHTSSGQITYSTGSGTFNNNGYITKTFASSGFTYIYAPFNNSGSVAVANGTFQMSPAGSATNTNTGTWRTTSASASLQHSSGTLNVDGVITGTGTVLFTGGTVNYNTGTYSVTNTTVGGATVVFAPGTSFSTGNILTLSSGTLNLSTGAPVALKTVTHSGGTLTGFDDFTITTYNWTGGTLSGASTSATVTGALNMANSNVTLDSRTLNNAGTGIVSGGSAYLIMYGGAVFNNQAGASLQFDHTGTGQFTYSTGSGTFNNAGVITKTASSNGFTYFYVPFNNSGSVTVNGGTLYLGPTTATTSNHSGPFSVGTGATLQVAGSGTVNFATNVTGLGSGIFSGGTTNFNSGAYNLPTTTVSGGTVTFAAGVSFNSPNLTVSSGTLSLNTGTAQTFNGVTLSGGTLTGADTFSITAMTWTGGTLSGSGTTTVTGTLGMANSSVTLDGRTFNNAGTATVSGGSFYLTMYNGAVFNNQAGAALQVTHTGTGQFTYSTGSGTFNNAGAITKTVASTGITYIYVPFNNSGSVTVNAGTLYLSPATATTSNHSGPFSVATGATLQVAGSGTVNFATNVTGLGSGIFSGGTTNFNSGAYNLPNTTVSGGTVTFAVGVSFSSPNLTVSSGTLSLNTSTAQTFNGVTLSSGTLTGADNFSSTAMTWTGGTLSGSGTTTVTGTLDMPASSVTLDGRTFNNAGSATVSGGSFYLTMYNGAVFNNQAGAALQVTHTGTGQFTYSTGGGTFNNAGAITKTVASTGITYIYVPFNNSGSVTVNAGTLYLSPATATTSNHSGPFSIANGATLQVAGSGTLNFATTITGAGSGVFSGSTANFISGTYSLSNMTVSGGTVNLNTGTAQTFNGVTLSNGTLTGADNFSSTAMTWTGGTLSGSGTTTVTGTLDMPASSVTLDGRILNNAGSATVSGGSFYMTLYNGAVFNNQAGASLQLNHTGTGQLTYSTGGGSFNNSGAITKSLVSNGYTYIYATYSQSGSFALQGGTVYFNPNTGTTGNITGAITLAPGTLAQFAGSGTFNFNAGSSLSGAGAVTFSSGTVNFKTGSTYAISTTQVNGGLADFSATSAVTFDDVTAGSGTFRIGDITVTGDFTRTFGTFTVLSGTVTFAGGTTQNLKLDQSTTFNNLTVNPGTTLVETVDANNASVAGVLTNNGTLRKNKAMPTASVYTLGLTGATISVTVKGTLSSVAVDQVGTNHPAATGQTVTGRYWTILPTGNSYTVSLTLLNTVNPANQATVCYFDTAVPEWVCDKTTTTANTVTLGGISNLAYDWAVGKPGGRLYLPLVLR
ncbi:MAG: hypothetical protein KA765_02225 [Thermoflexales bacterium]|nr:hypothetical protein [Thermoflexales bacterium]